MTDAMSGSADVAPRRYRSFIARPAPAISTASRQAMPTEDEFPVLTEVATALPRTSVRLAELLQALQADLDATFSVWLAEVLPAVVANASQQILAELDTKTRRTLLPQLQALIAARGEAVQPADRPVSTP